MSSRTTPEHREQLRRRTLARRKMIAAHRKAEREEREADPLRGYTIEEAVAELSGEKPTREKVVYWLEQAERYAQGSGRGMTVTEGLAVYLWAKL